MKHSIIYFLAGVTLFCGVTDASLIVPKDMAELYDIADRVFLGEVIAQESEKHQGIPVFRTEFRVIEGFKNATAGQKIRIRQINSTRFSLAQMIPRFKKGQVVYLFLAAESRKGLASPLGLELGVLRTNAKEKSVTKSSLVSFSAFQKKAFFGKGAVSRSHALEPQPSWRQLQQRAMGSRATVLDVSKALNGFKEESARE